jgi:hypothetical protein
MVMFLVQIRVRMTQLLSRERSTFNDVFGVGQDRSGLFTGQVTRNVSVSIATICIIKIPTAHLYRVYT